MDEINFIVFLSFKFLFHTHKSNTNICNILQIIILLLDLVAKNILSYNCGKLQNDTNP